jgi:hypothetical protein
MKQLVAVVLGFLSGLLVYFIAAVLFSSPTAGRPPVGIMFVVLLVAWILSTWLLLRGARSVSKVFSRGFLVGAAEWLSMGVAGLIFMGRVGGSVATAPGASDATAAGAAIGTGIGAALMGGVSLFMTIACLIGFAVSYSLGREMKREDAPAVALAKCPQCAESIQPDARKCRYCGSEIAPATGS